MRQCRLFIAVLFALILTTPALAALIPVDLSISASTSFADESVSGGLDVSHNATMSIVQGGITTQSTVNDTAVTGFNPLAGLLSDINDGISIGSLVSGRGLGAAPGYYFDFDFLLQNNSLTTVYFLSFVLQFDNLTSASGDDTFADSKILLFDADDTEFFFSDLTTDTLFGDEKNGAPTNTFGVTQIDAGSFAFDIVLGAGAMNSFRGELQLIGEEFNGQGSFGMDSFASLSLAAARPLDTPPPQIPLPASGWLFALGLFLVTQRQLRKLP
ncbi:hypothetical protein [Rheinheimera maricola]|uniref:PEP-CTERM sorting domain-containing protein n=1 Tax=Rheinheimera maricola TaxID=2793282 RepID=A0ABS7XB12_9GAMM|nr:hypothetical protein [Rheinheimera maricola]MBZ9612374.1 hypothetical protein [Rheinheimera maricola]